MVMKEEFKEMFAEVAEDMAGSLGASREELAEYMKERADHLATLAGDPGFDRAVIAERNNVALKAGLLSSMEAGRAEAIWVTVIGRVLRIAAIAIA